MTHAMKLITPSRRAKGVSLIFLLLWSSGFVFLKLGLEYADPITFLALRYMLAVGILLIPAIIFRAQFPKTRRAWLSLAVTGLLIQTGYFTFTYLALKLGLSAGTVSLINSQQPVLLALLAPALIGEKQTVTRWLGIACGVAGSAIVILAKSSIAVPNLAALVFCLLALVSLTAGTLWEKRFSTGAALIPANFIQYSVGLAVTLPLAFCLEDMRVDWTPEFIGSLLYLVIANSILAISLFLAMIRAGEASKVSALLFLVPPTTAIMAYLGLGESIPPVSWLGMALAAFGLYCITHERR